MFNKKQMKDVMNKMISAAVKSFKKRYLGAIKNFLNFEYIFLSLYPIYNGKYLLLDIKR